MYEKQMSKRVGQKDLKRVCFLFVVGFIFYLLWGLFFVCCEVSFAFCGETE